VKVVLGVVPTAVPFRKILYPATGLSGSVEAVQFKAMLVIVVETTVTPAGTVGGVVSIGMEGRRATTIWFEAAPLEANDHDIDTVPAELTGPSVEAAPKPAE
jgi:hypothetical protein